MAAKIHVGNRTRFSFTAITDAGTVYDISAATVLNLVFQRPDGTLLEVTPTLVTDGSDGKFYYDTVETDLNQEGSWRVQLFTDIDPGHSTIEGFKVFKNLK